MLNTFFTAEEIVLRYDLTTILTTMIACTSTFAAIIGGLIANNIDRGLSPYTLKLQVSALCKLYSCSSTDFIPTPPRKRKNITRSRSTRINHNTEFERFCLSTGLRRREITALRGTSLIEENGQYYIKVDNGKGGRKRISEIVGTPEEIAFVVDIMKKADNRKVFSEIPDIDIHTVVKNEELLSKLLTGEELRIFREYVAAYGRALANCIDRNKCSDYESFYKLRNDWFVQKLEITPDEIAELGMFQLSKRELKKKKNKQNKQEQAMQVVELAANGMKHQTIADTFGISKRKVQYILKAAGVTREYNRKAA